MTVRIRQATTEDLMALRSMETLSFTTDCISARQMRYLVSKANALCEIAEVDNRLAGYLIALTPKRASARIYSVAVLPDFRGQGIGSALMQSALAYLKLEGYRNCYLEVKADDLFTQNLYRRMGFADLKTLPNYYQSGENAIKMRKVL